MLIAIIGENCTGKSTLAEQIKETVGGEVLSGRDYLRLARSESEAVSLFKEKLKSAVNGENLIYVITEKQHVEFLPKGAVKILVYADLDVIKERFKARMHGNLPDPIAKMLESKHGVFDDGEYDYRYDGGKDDPSIICEALKSRFGM